MNFVQHLRLPRAFEIHPAAWVNVLFLFVAMVLVCGVLIAAVPWNVHLSGVVTSDALKDQSITIVLTGENVLYYKNNVVTMDELRKVLSVAEHRRPIFLKVDRRASVGRITDVWNMARSEGCERINVATAQEE